MVGGNRFESSHVPSRSRSYDTWSILYSKLQSKYRAISTNNKSDSGNGGKMSELKKIQENVKRMVENGEISKEAGITIIIDKALEMLDALKMPENQEWEKREHPEFFTEVN